MPCTCSERLGRRRCARCSHRNRARSGLARIPGLAVRRASRSRADGRDARRRGGSRPVNFRALRLSLLKQVVGAYLDGRAGRALGPAERSSPPTPVQRPPILSSHSCSRTKPSSSSERGLAERPSRHDRGGTAGPAGSAVGGDRRHRRDDARRLAAAARCGCFGSICRLPRSPGVAAAGRAERAAVQAPASARADDLEAHRHRASRRSLRREIRDLPGRTAPAEVKAPPQ